MMMILCTTTTAAKRRSSAKEEEEEVECHLWQSHCKMRVPRGCVRVREMGAYSAVITQW